MSDGDKLRKQKSFFLDDGVFEAKSPDDIAHDICIFAIRDLRTKGEEDLLTLIDSIAQVILKNKHDLSKIRNEYEKLSQIPGILKDHVDILRQVLPFAVKEQQRKGIIDPFDITLNLLQQVIGRFSDKCFWDYKASEENISKSKRKSIQQTLTQTINRISVQIIEKKGINNMRTQRRISRPKITSSDNLL
jgi:hypothetical protein